MMIKNYPEYLIKECLCLLLSYQDMAIILKNYQFLRLSETLEEAREYFTLSETVVMKMPMSFLEYFLI